MPSYVKASGTWQELTGTDQPYVKVSGTWQGVKNIYTRASGVWQTVYEYDITPPSSSITSVSSGGSADTVSWAGVTDAGSGVASATLYQLFYNASTGAYTIGNTYSIPTPTSAGSTSIAIASGYRNVPGGNVFLVQYYITAADNAGNSTSSIYSPQLYTKPLGDFVVAPDLFNLGNNAADSRNIGNSAWLNQTTADEGVVGVSTTKAYGAWFYNNDAFFNVCRGWAPDSGTIWLQRAGAAQPNRGNSGTFTISGHESPTKSGALNFVGVTASAYISGNDGTALLALSSGYLGMLSLLGANSIKGFGVTAHSASPGFLRGLTVSTNNNPFGIYSGTVFLSFT